MLTTAQIQAELDRVTYKPDWTFTAYQGVWEGQHLQIIADVYDAQRPEELITIDVHTPIPPIPDVAYLHRFLAWRIGRIENHEMREFLQIDGKPIYDPHARHADRDRE